MVDLAADATRGVTVELLALQVQQKLDMAEIEGVQLSLRSWYEWSGEPRMAEDPCGPDLAAE